MTPLLLGASAVVAAAGEVVPRIVNGQPPLQAVRSAGEGVVATVSSVRAISPTYRNSGSMATTEQIAAWETKVGRPASLRSGINQVARVATNPLTGGSHPHDMRVFARRMGEVSGTGIKGGYCLAVLCSVETWIGVAGHGSGACWNWNLGNTKYSRSQSRQPNLGPCYFLVDRVHSLDFYAAFNDLESAVRAWGNSTWANTRYNARVAGKKTCLEAMRDGDLPAFCEALGRGGYADSYRLSRDALTPRAKLLSRVAPYARFSGPSALDAGVLTY